MAERQKAALEEADREFQIRRTMLLMERSGLGNALERCTFMAFNAPEEWQRNMKEKAMVYAEKPEGWFFLAGQSGCGKTHICTAIAGRLMERGIPVAYMLWRQHSDKLKASNRNVEERDTLLQQFGDARCLYIDDLFKGGCTEADMKLAFELLDKRYRKAVPTVISTEMSLPEIMRRDEAVGGRIAEMAGKNVVSIERKAGRNWRLRGFTQNG